MTPTLLRLSCLIVATFALGLRIWPLMAGEPLLSRLFLTDSGYLMLTVARNMALEAGMSVADGTILTNGVQPLATYIAAGGYWLVGGDKLQGLVIIGIMEILWSLLGALAVWAFARKTLSPMLQQASQPFAFGVAAIWFSGPLLLHHSMNGLETGLYTALLIGALLWFPRILRSATSGVDLRASYQSSPPGALERLTFGAYCGVVFLARNDAAFLIIAIFAVWAVTELAFGRKSLGATLVKLALPGLSWLAVAAPWMLHNKVNFGSILPISGAAQELGMAYGQNLPLLPLRLTEHMLPMLIIPPSLADNHLVMVLCLILLGFMGLIYLLASRKLPLQVRLMLTTYTLFGTMLALLYGMHFGAPDSVGRYLAPLAPLLIVVFVTSLAQLLAWIARGLHLQGTAFVMMGILALSAGQLGRQVATGALSDTQMAGVDWLRNNVSPETWVGAYLSGSLGYWHDRTIDLSGRVNPQALAELRSKGHISDYVIASPIIYIIDWAGVEDWLSQKNPTFGTEFERILFDPAENLTVLHRKEAP